MRNKDHKFTSLKVSVKNMEAEGDIDFSSDSGKHKLATIMFSDICGFTKMMGKDEKKTMEIVEQNKLIHQQAIYMHNGNLIKEMGDGLLASFESTHDAVRCAKSILEEVNEEGNYSLHIGIHLGDIIFTREDIFGDGVNIAARINACASDGEIVVSEEVWKNIKNQTEFRSVYLGKRTLKNVDHHVRLYRILLDEEKKSIQFKAVYHTYSNKIKFGIVSILIASLLLVVFNYVQSPLRLNNGNRTIAVLPFDNRSEAVEFEYLRESLAEDVISQLFNLSSYTVISSRSSFQFKNSDKSLQQISKELKADILLIGNFNVSNEEIEVKIEVVEGDDNEILNYANIGANFDDIKSISKQIGQSLYQTLDISSEISDRARKKDSEIINIEAYKLNALGKSAMHDNTGQKLADIIQYFQAAIDIDSTYVDPYLGIAEAYIFDGNRGYISSAEAVQKAREYALIAEKLRPGLGEVSSIMGTIHYLNWEFKKAVPYFKRSLEESPNFHMTYTYYAFCLESMGKFDEALDLLKKATIIDPLDAFNDVYIALNYMFQDNMVEAHRIIDAKLEIEPDHAMNLWVKAILLNKEQKYEEALKALEKRGFGFESNYMAGYAYAMLGDIEKASFVLNNMIENSKKQHVPPSQIAVVYCGLGDVEKAIEQVEEAFLIHDIWIGHLIFTGFSDPIKDDPRYVSLMNSLFQD